MVGATLSFAAIGAWLGFVPLPGPYWAFLIVILVSYMALTQGVKGWMIRRFGLL